MYRYNAYVTDIVDGDTIKVVIDLGFGVMKKETVRLAGIDSAELKDKKNQDKAQTAKKHLETNILNKEVILKSLKPKLDKYGRYLAFLYFEGQDESFNDQMVKNGLAKAYDGKGKRPSHDAGKK